MQFNEQHADDLRSFTIAASGMGSRGDVENLQQVLDKIGQLNEQLDYSPEARDAVSKSYNDIIAALQDAGQMELASEVADKHTEMTLRQSEIDSERNLSWVDKLAHRALEAIDTVVDNIKEAFGFESKPQPEEIPESLAYRQQTKLAQQINEMTGGMGVGGGLEEQSSFGGALVERTKDGRTEYFVTDGEGEEFKVSKEQFREAAAELHRAEHESGEHGTVKVTIEHENGNFVDLTATAQTTERESFVDRFASDRSPEAESFADRAIETKGKGRVLH